MAALTNGARCTQRGDPGAPPHPSASHAEAARNASGVGGAPNGRPRRSRSLSSRRSTLPPAPPLPLPVPPSLLPRTLFCGEGGSSGAAAAWAVCRSGGSDGSAVCCDGALADGGAVCCDGALAVDGGDGNWSADGGVGGVLARSELRSRGRICVHNPSSTLSTSASAVLAPAADGPAVANAAPELPGPELPGWLGAAVGAGRGRSEGA